MRRVLDALGLKVNRLIRIAYGPFQLGTLAPGAVEEIPRKVLKEQLGKDATLVARRRGSSGSPGRRRGKKLWPSSQTMRMPAKMMMTMPTTAIQR